MTSGERAETRLPYAPGLDGLRALAVVAVLLYHADVAWIPGGFLGVDVFFVISGFLITALLLAEYRGTGRIDLPRFWVRRARRLLPAVFLMIAATMTFAVIFLPEEVAGLRTDALAAFGYVTNWYLVFAHESYFQAVGRPSLLKHLWSLAVEEQFYLIWPVILAVALAFLRRGGVLMLTLIGAVASVALMVSLYDPGADPSRIYYGTDTRAASLLLGAALAFVWTPGKGFVYPNRARSIPSGRRGRRLLRRWGWMRLLFLDLAGLLALGALVWFCLNVGEFDPFLYRGGFALIALVTAVLIAAAVHPHAHLGALGWGPMRWIGLRSYGIYLWHWPVFMVTRPGLDVSLDGLPLLAVRLVGTVALADLSYRYVEAPIRRGALGQAWKDLRRARGPRKKRLGLQWSAASVACVAFLAVLGTNMVGAEAPEEPHYLQHEAIQSEVPTIKEDPPKKPEKERTPEEKRAANPENAETQSQATVEKTTGEKTTDEPGKAPGEGSGSVAPAPDGLVTAIGDSVMLGASGQLEARIPDFQVTDAVTGMQVTDAISILEARKAAGELGDTVVIHIGSNGTFTAEEFDEMMEVLADTPRVVFVNVRVPRSWEASNNEVLREGTKEYDNATLVDWYAASEGHYEYFWEDGIHLRPEGAKAYADLIAKHLGR